MTKKFLAIAITIILLIIIVHTSLFFYNSSKYKDYSKGMEKLPDTNSYIKGNQNINYMVKNPDYPTFTGNLGVSLENGKYSLIVWPKLFSDYEYGVRLTNKDGSVGSYMVDKNMNPIDKKQESELNKYKKQLDLLNKYKNQQWNIKE